MNDLFWVFSGLVIATGSAIVSAAHADLKRFAKWLLILLAFLGLYVGGEYAIKQNEDKIASESRATTLQWRVEELKREAKTIAIGVGALQLKAEDLVALNQMAGYNARYYVQIAAGGTAKELEESRRKTREQFGIAKMNNIVAIIDRKRLGFLQGLRYVLVFGHHQTLTAAEVFQRLANGHHLPQGEAGKPGFASIKIEPPDFAKAIVPE